MKSNECNFRVEFRYEGGTKHYKYYPTINDAAQGTDSMEKPVRPWLMDVMTVRPRSKQIQQKGPRGGWSKAEAK